MNSPNFFSILTLTNLFPGVFSLIGKVGVLKPFGGGVYTRGKGVSLIGVPKNRGSLGGLVGGAFRHPHIFGLFPPFLLFNCGPLISPLFSPLF